MDDRELIRRCVDKDDKAWREFLKSYGACIYGSIASLLAKFSIHEPEIAEDIFASVIEKLITDECAALKRFGWNSRVSTWLVSVARNKTYDYLRSRRRRPTISLSTPVEGRDVEIEQVLADDLDLDHDLEIKLTVREALRLVPTRDRLILKMYYIEGMKEREIGELLDLSVDAVSARKSRALKKLKKLVRKGGP